MKNYSILIVVLLFALCHSHSQAADWEFSAHIGNTWAPDLAGYSATETIAIDDGMNFGLGIAWQDSPSGMGQVLLSQVSHDFVSEYDQSTQSLDILYGHFNGVALFKQQNYTSTVSLGLGGAMFSSDQSEQLYPSATIALGTRYQFSDNLSFFTELRGYASLVDEEDNLFCDKENCHAQFEDSLWMEANITIGIAIKF